MRLSDYLDLPQRSLRQVRGDMDAEYRRLADTETKLTVALWSAPASDRKHLKARHAAVKRKLEALDDRLETLDAEILAREERRAP